MVMKIIIANYGILVLINKPTKMGSTPREWFKNCMHVLVLYFVSFCCKFTGFESMVEKSFVLGYSLCNCDRETSVLGSTLL